MPFRPVFPRLPAGRNRKTFIIVIAALCLAAAGLLFSAGFFFAGERRDAPSAAMTEEAAGERRDAPSADTAGEAAGEPAATEEEPASAAPSPERGVFRMAALPASLRPGEPVTVGLALPAAADTEDSPPVYAVLVGGQGRSLSRAVFFALPGSPDSPAGVTLLAAVLAVPSTFRPGPAFIRTDPPIEGLEDIPLTVTDRDFVSETIDLNAENTGLRTVEDPQKTAEADQLWGILHRQGETVYAEEAFEAPVSSTRRTSFFGDRRVYRYTNGSTDTAVHAGIDYGVPLGTEVYACAPGKVVLARPRIVTGNSVVIEHLPGLYSLYYHLDTLTATEGALVEKGAPLGKSGATGLATGPHLHWEIRAAGENADPDAFMGRSILDTTAISSKLFD